VKLLPIILAALALNALAQDQPETKPEYGRWTVRKEVSPIDDSQSYICSLEADAPVTIGYKTVTPRLMVRWKERELNVYVSIHEVFLGIDSMDVTMRIDQQPATTAPWEIGTNRSAVFAPDDHAKVLALIKSRQVTIRLTPYSESPATFTFNTLGFAFAIKPITAVLDAARPKPAAPPPAVASRPASASERDKFSREKFLNDPMTGKPSGIDMLRQSRQPASAPARR